MDKQHHPSLMEAIETLETIVDLEETGRELELFLNDLDAKRQRVAWLRDETGEEAVARVRELFSVILSYLKHFEREDNSELRLPGAQREITTMMVLVGEAAEKLDRYTNLFHGVHEGTITGLKEYQELRHFYAKRLDDRLGAQRDLTAEPTAEEEHGAQDQLERVKRDIDYELFSLRRENGTPFVTRDLVDRVKLICSFGELFLESYVGDDPLVQVHDWRDQTVQIAAKNIVDGMRPYLDGFYPLATTKRENRFVARLGDAVLALKMAASPYHRILKEPVKSCSGYFADFQLLLREALTSEEYHRLIAYPPRGNKFLRIARDLVHAICYQLYTEYRECRDVVGRIHQLVLRGEELREERMKGEGLANWLTDEYESLVAILRRHPNGPLLKAFDWIQEGGPHQYDPLVQGNLPERWCDLKIGDETIALLRLPTPTCQERIHKAHIAPEFVAFVRSCKLSPIVQRLLIVNLQDRTSWKEHARAKAIEELQDQEEFEAVLTVVTLPTHTEFYHQIGLYRDLEAWPLFRHAFQEQFVREEGGYLFPELLQERLFPEFAERLLDGIHRLFFGGNEKLSRRQRLDCIDLFHLFLTYKLVEIVGPDFFAYCCKDGLDIGSTATCGLLLAAHLLSRTEIHPSEWDWLRAMLYAPVLMVRERPLQRAPFSRMVGMIETIEAVALHLGTEGFRRLLSEEIAPLYLGNVLEGRVATPFAADESA